VLLCSYRKAFRNQPSLARDCGALRLHHSVHGIALDANPLPQFQVQKSPDPVAMIALAGTVLGN
jgi:hypothetical protein